MTESQRKRVKRAIAMIQSGDRSGAVVELRTLASRPPPLRGSEAEQLVFAVVRFECPRLHLEMPVRECLETRGAVWPSGGRKGTPKNPQCVGCGIGERFAYACPGIRLRPPSQPPEVLPTSQRMAKLARSLVGLGPEDTVRGPMDPLTEASMLSRDDHGEWR